MAGFRDLVGALGILPPDLPGRRHPFRPYSPPTAWVGPEGPHVSPPYIPPVDTGPAPPERYHPIDAWVGPEGPHVYAPPRVTPLPRGLDEGAGGDYPMRPYVHPFPHPESFGFPPEPPTGLSEGMGYPAPRPSYHPSVGGLLAALGRHRGRTHFNPGMI